MLAPVKSHAHRNQVPWRNQRSRTPSGDTKRHESRSSFLKRCSFALAISGRNRQEAVPSHCRTRDVARVQIPSRLLTSIAAHWRFRSIPNIGGACAAQDTQPGPIRHSTLQSRQRHSRQQAARGASPTALHLCSFSLLLCGAASPFLRRPEIRGRGHRPSEASPVKPVILASHPQGPHVSLIQVKKP